MKCSVDSLINAVLSKKSFRHPNQKVFKGDYEFVRFNHDRTVALNDCETGERIKVNEDVIFSTMQTEVTEDYFKMLFHGANYKKTEQSQPKCTEILDNPPRLGSFFTPDDKY